MRVRATCPKTGKVNTFKIYLRCLHQGRAEKGEKANLNSEIKTSTKRNTNCPAGMIIAIRRHVKYSRSKMRDPVDPVHPCEIQLRFVHNHPTDSVDSLRFRPVSKEMGEKLLNLYQSGHSPSSALEVLKMDLQLQYGSSYSQIVSDRFHCPDKSFCYRLYYKHFGKDYASLVKKDLLGILNSKGIQSNNVLGETCVNIGTSGTDIAIAVCTPLMKRAHSLQMSGNTVFVDSFDSPCSKERTEHHVQLLLTHTAVGGIPLGVVLTTSKSSECLTHGFQLLKEMLPGHAFYGRGAVGPCAFLVDDSDSLRLALSTTWPGCDIMLCSFRILQSVWRWLWDEKHVLKDHQLYLLYLLKVLLFATNEADMNNKYQALCTDAMAVHYPLYLQLVKCLWEKKNFWGLCFHQLLPLQGANNYYEAAVRALKDKVFEGTKTFNLVQLLNYVVTRIDMFYKAKVLDVLNGKALHVFRSHYDETIPPHVIDEIKLIVGNYFLVPSEFLDGKIYNVDAELNVCSCSVGITGAHCLHQYWIFLKVNSELFKVSYCDEEFRQKLFFVATGSMQLHSLKPTQVLIDATSISLPHVECPTLPEASPLAPDPVLKGSEVLYPINNSQQQNAIDRQGNHGLELVPPVSNYSQAYRALSENDRVISRNDSEVGSFSNNELRVITSPRNEDNSISSDNTSITLEAKTEENSEKSDVEKRMDEALSKFDHFYDLVKNGLKSQPEKFLPALEIMTKNLERKEFSSDVLISGLSFFGVMSAQTTKQKEKKKPIKENFTEEIMPKVHGHQMITYGRKRSSVPNREDILPTDPTILQKSGIYQHAQLGKK